MVESDLLEGYLDGLRDERTELPAQSNRSELYSFGWLNGRDDRIGKPRFKNPADGRVQYEAVVKRHLITGTQGDRRV